MPTTERFDFDNPRGQRLSGRLERLAGPARAVVLLVHCFTCGKDSTAAIRLARALAADGLAVLRFDMTGIGGSEGEFVETSFTSNLDDIAAAAAALSQRVAPVALLVGHSFGGAAVLAVAARLLEIRAVVTIGAPFDIARITRHFESALPAIQATGRAEVVLGGRRLAIGHDFVVDLARHRQAERIAALGRPLAVLHAPTDAVVEADEAERILAAARHPKTLVALDGADHFLSGPGDAARAARLILAWAEPYLPVPARPAPVEGVLVRETGAGAFRNEVRSGTHRFLADEPERLGGGGTGPGPYDLLLASLGACTSMTLRMYADRKGWPLEGVEVELDHAKARVTGGTGTADHIGIGVRLIGPLDAAQRARLLEIADQCPVHRTLEGDVRMRTHALPV
ncbi:bifunctional alpha/beta hydrolase/OsmC family protein [Sediminicoccus rosea]|uniref:Alpha/beta fold hydrolase n=1 Tax=Sediminicoccus rosea TaxID=1225128 RepID=A0ABZ0PE18_9PROT|nr:alpha/beta fold hydrolase [Sediminicoccus rosea]WPB83667.1 alpha/beta fold hydrolase [Sediminicoccus rosea]